MTMKHDLFEAVFGLRVDHKARALERIGELFDKGTPHQKELVALFGAVAHALTRTTYPPGQIDSMRAVVHAMTDEVRRITTEAEKRYDQT